MTQENQTPITKNFIDLEKVIASKSKHLARFMPGFVLWYLKRVIHQEELNDFLYKNRHYHGLDFVAAIISEFNIDIRVKGIENLPKTGPQILVSNHPLGGLDGIALMHIIGKIRKDFIFPVNDLLLFIPNMKDLFLPINKHGKNTQNIRLFDRAFSSEQLILYFPAGLVSRKKKGVIKDLEWKKTFLSKARKYKRDVIPVHIGGKNSNFFYRLANLRSALKIKANIEMLYLVDEMFKHQDNSIPITIGKPIPYTYFDPQKQKDKAWAQTVKKQVYALGENAPLPIPTEDLKK
ncbi:MAG: 1-acyl-sn-glycerol-3-phosphate acyltransferase [Bacteroidales bacterium]